MRYLVCFACFVVVMVATAEAAQEGGKKADDGRLVVRLEMSAQEFDPANPGKATVKCFVVNKSDKDIEIRTGYPGDYDTLLYGSPIKGRGTVSLHTAKSKPGAAKVKPGKESEVFTLPLEEILLPRTAKPPVWRWDWPLRVEPPESPIHVWRGKGFVEQADFWAVITVDGKSYTSEKVALKVKGGK